MIPSTIWVGDGRKRVPDRPGSGCQPGNQSSTHHKHHQAGRTARPDGAKRKEYGFEARLQKYFALAPRMVSVEVQHLMDDYWRLWTFHAGVNEWSGIEVEDGATAYALVRITGSRDKLPYTAEGSPRVAAEC